VTSPRIPTLGDLLAMVERGDLHITCRGFVGPNGEPRELRGTYTFAMGPQAQAERVPHSEDDGEGDCG
jgi:hypothetical protein